MTLKQAFGELFGVCLVLSGCGKREQIREQLLRIALGRKQPAVEIASFIKASQAMERDGLAEQRPLIFRLRVQNRIEVGQRRFVLTGLQQA
ncbi:MAG: hypothetical protein WDO18_09870 [Acidobacteriota bacterium]